MTKFKLISSCIKIFNPLKEKKIQIALKSKANSMPDIGETVKQSDSKAKANQ